jgi:hypothetical protein
MKMSNIIKIKRSGDEGATPSDLELGEIAINYKDGKIFYKSDEGIIEFLKSQRLVFNQDTPSSSWSINHSLGGFPSVSVVDSSNTLIFGEIIYNNTFNVTINFTAPFSGKAFLT